jgi:hypothetical protein
MQTAAPPGEQPHPTRPPTVATDGYGDPDHDDAEALGVDLPTAPPPADRPPVPEPPELPGEAEQAEPDDPDDPGTASG